MRLEDLKVGDKVTRFGYYGIDSFTTVAKVGKRTLMTTDGSTWNMSGRLRGSDTWSHAHLSAYEPSHDERMVEQNKQRRRQQIAGHLAAYRWYNESLEKLEAVQKLITPETPATPATPSTGERPSE